MLARSADRISAQLDEAGLVLDVGGGARPFPRADYVLDLVGYGERGMLGWDGDRRNERFTSETWIQRDICDREPWPFADRQFDFAVCSHTLEDVRDPVWAARELQRVAAAGYIEVPALREELTYGVQGPWVGWGHHRWLVLVEDQRLGFLFKHQVINRRGCHLPPGSVDSLAADQRIQELWWEDAFTVTERFMTSPAELDRFLAEIAAAPSEGATETQRGRRRWPSWRR
jgi:hypothetical protein